MLAPPLTALSPTVILLAPGFDARLITEIATLGRQAGRAVALIGLVAGPMRSEVGISLLPDKTLDQLALTEAVWLLIPGGRACVQALVRDPRVHRLCQDTLTLGGQVVADPTIAALVQEVGLPIADPYSLGEPAPWFRAHLRQGL